MDPAGIKFGLSHNLLQLDGAGLVIAPEVLEGISDMARRLMLTGSPLLGTDFGDHVIGDGIQHLLLPIIERGVDESELIAFLKGLSLVLCDTLIPIAVQCHVGQLRSPEQFFPTDEFLSDLTDNAFEATAKADDMHRRYFDICRATVTVYFARHDPASMKHADLLTLFLMNHWIDKLERLENLFFQS